MRSIALDVHRDFCEVAIKDESGLRLARRIKTSPAELELFAQSLAPDDQVALEASEPALAIARILEPHAGRVLIGNTRKLRAIAESKVKTDKLDASTLCELLAADFLPAVWSPNEFTRALRRRLQRRAKLVRSRTRAKNECHAVLARNLKGKPPMSDVCGRKGRQWLAALELPADESETVACCLREVDFLDAEIALIESELASQALSSGEIRRLMTVPGVSLVSAATFVAVVGDAKRFSSPKRLVSYVGLDPRVRQSGAAPARHGRISKQGSPEARHMLCEAAWVLIRTPGPLRALYERVRARRGAQIALVATARKLSVLFWHLLSREQDYAFERPTLTRRKLRGLELKAKDGRRCWPSGHAIGTQQDRESERQFADQIETAYRKLIADWQPQTPEKRCGRDTGARIFKSSSWRRDGSAAGRSPRTCALARRHPHQQRLSHKGENFVRRP
jgi:transposase